MTTVEAPPKAGRREWLGLTVLVLLTMLLAVDVSVLFLALPHLSAELGADSTQQLWITDIYGFMTAGLLVTMGTLGDRIGRRKLLLIGAAGFGVASALAAFSTTPEMLIAARALMGICGATLLPSTMALISNMFREPKQMGTAMALWGTAFMAGVAFGPVVGGAMLESFWWGSVFVMALPVMALVLVAAPFLLPEYRDPKAGRLDPTSVVLSLVTILPVIYGLKDIARNGWTLLPVLSILVGLAFGVVFVRRQRKLTDPVLDLRLFGIRTVTVVILVGLGVAIVQAGTGLVAALHLQMVEGLEPLQAGLWLVPPSIALVLGISVGQGLSRKIRPGYVLAGGLVVSAIGQLLLTQVDSAGGGLALLVIGVSLAYMGVGPGASLINQLVLLNAPPEKAGSASALTNTGGEFGVAFGIAALGTVVAAVYHDQVTIPASAPANVAGPAQESIAGAVATAGELPPAAGTDLLNSAHEAFGAGQHTVAIVCTVVFVGLAVLAAVGLRHVPPIGETPAVEGEPEPGTAEATEVSETASAGTTPVATNTLKASPVQLD